MSTIVDQILTLKSDVETDKVDFVLAFDSKDEDPVKIEKRRVFESNLQREGLKLVYENEGQIHFIKITAPRKVLFRYAEILKFRLPLKPVRGQQFLYEKDSEFWVTLKRCCLWCFQREEINFSDSPIFYDFSLPYAQLYELEDPNTFTSGMRNNIVYFILQREFFVANEESFQHMGIKKLLEDEVYISAYPLHMDKDREILLSNWGCVKKCFNSQPLTLVYQYFGAKVALYFAWLGFYNGMLLPLSIFGFICFFYGLITLPTDQISHDVCHNKENILMCPLCDENCDYWELKHTCHFSKVNYLLDNHLSILYAIMISIWSVLYLEFWKQYSAELVHKWGLTNYSQQVEYPRPRYLSRLYGKTSLTVALNAANRSLEPEVSFCSSKFLPNCISYGILVLLICISLIAIFAMIVYRMAQLAAHSVLGDLDSVIHKILVLPITAGILALIVITALNFVYRRVAVSLTNYQCHRTQTEYEESLAIKYYIFQYVNYYSSLFYIALIKNKFVGYPGKYKRIFGFRQEECNPGGCLLELCLQLIIIMLGKQIIKGVIDILQPYVMITLRLFGLCCKHDNVKVKSKNPWTRDYNLEQFASDSLFKEYLEMVIQFGFVVLFGLAFPLAPFLAFIYNTFELRLNAIKFLRLLQRPIAQRERCIGVLYNIMQILTNISVIVNAVIISFSTNLIPKIVYVIVTGDSSLDGFLDFELALFDTKDFEIKPQIENSHYGNVTQCHYADYRNPRDHKVPYGRPIHYWYIWIGRLAFIVMYHFVINLLQTFVAWAVPDVSAKLMRRIQREEFLAREHIINFERESNV